MVVACLVLIYGAELIRHGRSDLFACQHTLVSAVTNFEQNRNANDNACAPLALAA